MSQPDTLVMHDTAIVLDQQALAGALAALGADPARPCVYHVLLDIDDETTRLLLGWSTLHRTLIRLVGPVTPKVRGFAGIDLLSLAGIACSTIVDDDRERDAPLSTAAILRRELAGSFDPRPYLAGAARCAWVREVVCKVSDLEELRPEQTRRAARDATSALVAAVDRRARV